MGGNKVLLSFLHQSSSQFYKGPRLIGPMFSQSRLQEAGLRRGLTRTLLQSLLRTDRTVRFPRTDTRSESSFWIEREASGS